MIELISQGLQAMEIPCTTEQAEQLSAYLYRLLEANEKMNLTAVRTAEQAVTLHLLDSATLLRLKFSARTGSRWIDLGTGGGLPGMVLAILRPDVEMTLCDATRKKTDFLRDTARDVGLQNVKVCQGRMEELGRNPAYRERYDLATARAVAALPILLEYCLPFVRPGGVFVSYKGQKAQEEMEQSRAACTALGGKALVAEPGLPQTDHVLICVEKASSTPKQYPRREAILRKKPL